MRDIHAFLAGVYTATVAFAAYLWWKIRNRVSAPESGDSASRSESTDSGGDDEPRRD